jgi:hypothetical protein
MASRVLGLYTQTRVQYPLKHGPSCQTTGSSAFDHSNMAPTKPSPLRQLVDIISSQVSEIEAIFEKQGVDYPSLDDPFVPGSQSELAAMAPDVMQCAMLVVAACGQLSTTLGAPGATLYATSAGVSRSASFFPDPIYALRYVVPHLQLPTHSYGKQHS